MIGQTALPEDRSVLWAFFDEYCQRLSRWEPRYPPDLDALQGAMMDDLAESVAALCVAVCRLEVRNAPPTRSRKRTLAEALDVEIRKIEAAANISPARKLRGIAYLINLLHAEAARQGDRENGGRRGRPGGGFSTDTGAVGQAVEDAFFATGNENLLPEVFAEGFIPNDGSGRPGRPSDGVATLMATLKPALDAAAIPDAYMAKTIRNARAKLKKSSV